MKRRSKHPRIVRPERGEADPPSDTVKRGRKRGAAIPARFKPRFWADADRRCGEVKRIEQLVERLRADSGAASAMKDLLVQRTAFLAVVLETAERRAVEDGVFDAGGHVQAVNALIGCLRMLGLERRVAARGLKTYLAERGA